MPLHFLHYMDKQLFQVLKLFSDKQPHHWKEAGKVARLNKRNFYNWLENPNKLKGFLDKESPGYYRVNADGLDECNRLKLFLEAETKTISKAEIELSAGRRNLAIVLTIPHRLIPDSLEVSERLIRKIRVLKVGDELAEQLSTIIRDWAYENPQPRTERALRIRQKTVKEV